MEGCLQFGTSFPFCGEPDFRKRGLISCSMILQRLWYRRGKDAIAVDAPAGNNTGNDFLSGAKIREGFDLIPMWVADMNFPALPAIPEAIIQRTKHPAYGYFDPSAAYYDGIINWQKTRNGVNDLTKECIGYENGVLGGVVSALKVLCSNWDFCLLQSPTYIGFTHCIEDNGWNIVLNPLVLDEEGIWRIDYEDMEEKIVQNKIHAAVFCSPHNPTGRVWERWEIEEAMEVYKNNECVVIADEIWSDLILKRKPAHSDTVDQSGCQKPYDCILCTEQDF